MRAVRDRLRRLREDEQGLTLIELLVASAMSVVLVGAAGSMMVSAMRSQPELSERSQSISTARWVQERITRELRNGIRVDQATASKVSFLTYVRHATCGGTGTLASGTAAKKCEVTYECTTTYCARIEAAEGVLTGTAVRVFEGSDTASVFCYVPSTEPDPLTCGPAVSAAKTTYVGIRLHIPNPSGEGSGLSVFDGASLRNATLTR
jgi:prepilin-type N-terminal cleavage/methylation domain-containing protein